MSAGRGKAAASKDLVYGIGTSAPVIRMAGWSKWKKASLSIILARTSAPIPQLGQLKEKTIEKIPQGNSKRAYFLNFNTKIDIIMVFFSN